MKKGKWNKDKEGERKDWEEDEKNYKDEKWGERKD